MQADSATGRRGSRSPRALAHAADAFGLPEAGGLPLTLEQALATTLQRLDAAHDGCG
ncbi:MAG: hypothetical protein M3Y74_02605 [Chloroflexota bacterium]|jgi:hypothetical protein|nr:hypothetical protein [Chloroflexota bacterium]